ncbi:DUF2637 domain-containing protein [Streptomyces sp. NPDC048188]|uniref:DUF2637 domain-containing protein n=1 Tax=Streptomyces sp. NPDC048188 TaxID=3155749 RepID=UPI0034291F1C
MTGEIRGTARIGHSRAHRILIGTVICGALIIAGIGFVGSYAAVRELAERKGFGSFSLVFPIGVDAGICVLLALDLLLTWIRIPFPLLRQTAWLLTTATIAFNGAAAWPDPLGVGMHAVIPVLFVIAVEAARHAVGRIADITADKHMEGVRLTRWLLSPLPTFLLWRRMKLWEIRNYEEAIRIEQHRLVYESQLRAEYGRAWRRRAPIEAVLPLRLARYGVPLAETAPHVLEEAGLDLSGSVTLVDEPVVAASDMTQPGDHQRALDSGSDTAAPHDLVEERAPQPEPEAEPTSSELSEEQYLQAINHYSYQYGALPNARQLGLFLFDSYGVADPLTRGPVVEEQLRPLLQRFRQLYASDTDAQAAVKTASADMDGADYPDGPEARSPQPIGHFTTQDTITPEPVGQAAAAPVVDPARSESAPAAPQAPEPVAAADLLLADEPAPQEQPLAAPEPSAAPMGRSDATGQQAKLEQQGQEPGSDPIQQQLVRIAGWLAEAEEEGEKLSGAEVARRLGVSPRTGQRRLDKAIEYRSEQLRHQGRGHLRSVHG